jgi:ATP-binding protein involved in chromosome partitioning
MDIRDGDHTEVAERARAAIAAVRDPEIGVSLGRLGMVRGVEVSGSTVKARIALTIPGCPMKERIAKDVASALVAVPGVGGVEVHFEAMSEEQRASLVSQLRGDLGSERFFADGRTTVIAVASGKGGVGKSTVTVNLACALADAGHRVGLIDADVWGFSVPQMLGVTSDAVGFDGILFPAEAHGVKVVSVGLFANQQAPVIWRGPLLHRTIRQFLADVHWGELDVLLVDLPPGTGDVPISLAAMLPEASVVVVTTPQEAAHTVAERAGRMAERARLRVVGVIENMAWFVCPCCGVRTEIFGEGGGQALADALGVPLLARVPMAVALRAAGDAGVPLAVADPYNPAAVALGEVAEQLLELARPPVHLPIVHSAGAATNTQPERSVQR